MVYLVWPELVDEVMHVDKQNSKILNFLISLLEGKMLKLKQKSQRLYSFSRLTAGEAGLVIRMSSNSKKQMRMERFSFFSSTFLSTRGGSQV